MTAMSLTTSGKILDAAEHLPEGAMLVVPRVSWDDYEQLLEGLAHRPSLRVSYDRGTIEIMSPSQKHERDVRFIEDLVRAFADARNLPLEKLGQATWKRRALARGIEPDACYFVQNAELVIGKNEFDLESDPPPDITVEIDVTASSLKKLSIYAALSVPEVWRYDGRTFRIYELVGQEYVEIAASRFLTGLTGSLLAASIELSATQGQTEALKEFRRRI